MTAPNLDNDRPERLASEGARVLKIDVPIYKIEDLGGFVRFHLYGGLVVDYPANDLPEASFDPRFLPVPAREKKKTGKKKPARRKEG